MSISVKLTQAYFNICYNQVYDFTTGRLSVYHKLQERCVDKVDFEDNDRVLCVGVGTGNEIFHILQMNRNVNITGVDYSSTALRKAYKKALRLGKEIELLLMDARSLEFPTGSFDKVLCLHVMDFVQDNEQVTSEILRVLKDSGRFVVTYPSKKEGARLGFNLLKNSIRNNLDSGEYSIRAFLEFTAQVAVGTVYLPLLFRPKKRFYSRRELESIITELTGYFEIEEYPAYQDFIVYGKKSSKGGRTNAS